MIYLVSNDEEAIENTAKTFSGEGMEDFQDFGDFSKEYTNRIVTSPLDLREKISIFDAGLDDRIIELAKLFYAGMAIEQFPDNRIHEVQFGTDENGSSYLAFIDENGVFANAELSEELYNDTKKLFEEKFSVTQQMLEKYIGCKCEAFSENDMVRLNNVYRSLKDGMAKREDFFDVPLPTEAQEITDPFSDKGEGGENEKNKEVKKDVQEN